ncbi:DUF2796 domain-containing protein [Xylophilus ampelinus]|nr:DUF2796 domain-containing protein [Xylophilus ampelinus]MCS4511720.1 DUF2796 domain-containing protein [Xylophilus ampelinus]
MPMPIFLHRARRPPRFMFAAALVLALPVLSWAQAPVPHAHTHGQARIDLAVEGDVLTLALGAPLDSLVGFEHAPRTAAERQRVAQMAARLRAADTLFVPDPAAGCTLADVSLESPVLGLAPTAAAGAAGSTGAADEHADLDATVRFQCRQSGRARFVEVRLFDAFPALRAIEVQAATPQGQFRRTLTPRAPRLGWER